MIEFTAHASSSTGNLYTLDDGKTRVIIDPGLPIVQIKKALNFGLNKIDYCLLSHAHLDHSCGVSGVTHAGIDVYTGTETIEILGFKNHRLVPITHREQFRLGTWTITALSVVHDVPNMAFLLASGKHKCLFMIDALYCPYYFTGLTHIFLGINYDSNILRENVKSGRLDPALGRRIISNHLSLATGLQFFKNQDLSKVQEIHILHCSKANLDKEKAKREIQKITGKLITI